MLNLRQERELYDYLRWRLVDCGCWLNGEPAMIRSYDPMADLFTVRSLCSSAVGRYGYEHVEAVMANGGRFAVE